MASSLNEVSAMPAELSGQQLDGCQLLDESEAAPSSKRRDSGILPVPLSPPLSIDEHQTEAALANTASGDALASGHALTASDAHQALSSMIEDHMRLTNQSSVADIDRRELVNSIANELLSRLNTTRFDAQRSAQSGSANPAPEEAKSQGSEHMAVMLEHLTAASQFLTNVGDTTTGILCQFFACTWTSIRVSALILQPFWPVFGPLLVVLFLTISLVWGCFVLLHGACGRAEVRTMSSAVSYVAQVDLCHSISRDVATLNTSSGLAVIQEGQAIGKAVNDLVESSRDVVRYSKVALHVWEAAGDIAADLQTENLFPHSEGISKSMWSVHVNMNDFLSEYSDFEINLKSIISATVADFRKLVVRFDRVLCDKDNQSWWHRMIDSSFQTLLGHRYYQHSTENALMAALVKSTGFLVPDLQQMFHDSQGLARNLQNNVAILIDVKTQLTQDENDARGECDALRKKLLKQPGSKLTWLKSWTPFQSDSACDKGTLPKRCCMPLPEYIKKVEEQILAVSSNAEHMKQIGDQLALFGRDLNAMRRITQKSGRLVFKGQDWEAAYKHAGKLLLVFEDIHEKWQGILLDPGPSSGTIKMIGRA